MRPSDIFESSIFWAMVLLWWTIILMLLLKHLIDFDE